MKKARIFLGLLLIMALMAFSGCGTNNTDTIDPDTPGTVTDDNGNDDGILDDDDNDNDILDNDDDDDLLDDDNNDNNPLDAKTTGASIENKDSTPDNQ